MREKGDGGFQVGDQLPDMLQHLQLEVELVLLRFLFLSGAAEEGFA